MIKSILRYPGGKNKALSYLLERMPDGIEDWREPFFGGGSVSIGFLQSHKSKDCKRFVVGDLYAEVYHMWKVIQSNPQKMKEFVYEYMNKWCPTHEKLMDTPGFAYNSKDNGDFTDEVAVAISEGKKFWEWASTVDCNTLTPEERAARFLIINRTSFSGMGDSGSMTADQLFGFKASDCEKVDELHKLLQPLEILNASFEVTVDSCNEERGFIFYDAPYYAQSKTPMYGKNGSTHKGFPHDKLAELCKTHKCKWLMTYDDSVAVRQLYRDYYINPFKLTYTMAGNTAEDALAGEELLISNYYKEDTDNDIDMSDIL